MAKKTLKKKNEVPAQHVTVYLLQSGVKPAQALNKDQPTDSLAAKTNVIPHSILYYTPEKSKPADWRAFLKSAFNDSKLPAFISQHQSAVLFITVANRTFAIPFGL